MSRPKEEPPPALGPGGLGRRAVPAFLGLAALIVIVLVAPGLDEARERLADADLGPLLLGVLLEVLSVVSYTVMFGGLIPVPGGIGGLDGGLIGALVLYGAPAAGAAAVPAYRLILFWVPLLVGGPAFMSLRRDMPDATEFTACEAAILAQSP